MTDKEIKKQIVSSYKKRTGFVNCVGSIEKLVEDLFPEIKAHLIQKDKKVQRCKTCLPFKFRKKPV
jgi:hypothetical protein